VRPAGVTRQGEYLWYYDQSSNYVGKTTTEGGLRDNFIPGDNTIRDLAWDGTRLWTMNTSGEMKKYTVSGVLETTVTGLLTGGWGIAFDGSHLWASDPGTDKIYRISVTNDSDPPGAPVIESATHPFEAVWYSDPDPVFTVTPPDDASGISGYSYLMDEHAETVPDDGIDGTGTTIAYVSVQDGVWYFHCRARDGAGNWGEVSHRRIQVDTTPPMEGTILIEDDIDTTKSLIVTLNGLQAEDTLSGMDSGAAMRFSNDGFSWSDGEPFAESRVGWDISQYGGSNSSGLKQVFVSFQDVAGNWSEPFIDEVIYSAPLVIETELLTEGTLGFAYAETLFASGGWPPYHWEVTTGMFPSGVTFDSDGILSGVPESEGTFDCTVRVTDAINCSATADLSITVFVETVKGDVNGDTKVDILDLVSVVRYILGVEGFTASQVWAADVVDDGTIDVTDVLGIVNIILESPGISKMTSSNGQAIISIEGNISCSHVPSDYVITLRSHIPVAGIQLDIQIPPGATLARPPQLTPWSQAFQFDWRTKADRMRLLLYNLSQETISPSDPAPIANLCFTEGTCPLHIEDVIVADSYGRHIPVRSSAENLISGQQVTDFRNHPNPFNTETFISFTLGERVHIGVAVYNVLGQKVRTLVSGERDAGEHIVSWDGTDRAGKVLPSGVYFCRIEAGSYGAVMEMVLLK
jgi:hypothetical protein